MWELERSGRCLENIAGVRRPRTLILITYFCIYLKTGFQLWHFLLYFGIPIGVVMVGVITGMCPTPRIAVTALLYHSKDTVAHCCREQLTSTISTK